MPARARSSLRIMRIFRATKRIHRTSVHVRTASIHSDDLKSEPSKQSQEYTFTKLRIRNHVHYERSNIEDR